MLRKEGKIKQVEIKEVLFSSQHNIQQYEEVNCKVRTGVCDVWEKLANDSSVNLPPPTFCLV